MKFEPRLMVTGIGSLPHKSPERACEVILENVPEAPFWPQLPNLNFLESMWVQFSQGMPGLVVLEDEKKVFIDPGDDYPPQVERFYQYLEAGNFDAFAIDFDHARGLKTMTTLLQRNAPESLKMVKGQVTGPISMGMVLTYPNRKSLLYDSTGADIVVNLVRAKGIWQERFLQSAFPGVPTLIFFDEPYLVSLGSAFFNVSQEEVIGYLDTCFDGLEGLSGIHCCGNSDWSVLLDTRVDVLNFDAYGFGETISLYPVQVARFLSEGRCLAWGIVPTGEEAKDESAASLVDRLENHIDALASRGIERDRIYKQSFITPSCGTGALSTELAERVFQLTHEVSESLREKHFQ
ncbi:MAG: methionine synthase [Deltaproteobacteria bacterium]|nr:methionine synthase [Deltaproteobacteria bacterium]